MARSINSLTMSAGLVPRKRIELPLQPRDQPAVHPPRIREDNEERIPQRGLLVEVVNPPEHSLDPGVKEEGLQAIDDESPGTPLIKERRRGRPEILQATGIRRADPAQPAHPEDLPSVGDPLRTARRDPQERGPDSLQEPEERGNILFGVEREIAQAPLQRWADASPTLCMRRRADSNGPETP